MATLIGHGLAVGSVHVARIRSTDARVIQRCRVGCSHSQRPNSRNVVCTLASEAAAAVESNTERASAFTKGSPRPVGAGARIVGTGSAVPTRVITNDDLSKIVDTSDDWIATRTGIRRRRIVSDGESLTSLSTEACQKALAMGGVQSADVDLVILCTSTPEDVFGSAGQVQRNLGCKNALAFDLTAACSGFVLGLVTASRFIKGGGFHNVLVVGADTLSRFVDWTDRGTCILFGDGAGAVLVQSVPIGEGDGVLGFDMHSDGQGGRHLHCLMTPAENGAAVTSQAKTNPIFMNGREVYKFAVTSVPQVLEAALNEAGISPSEVDWLLLHQANQRIMDAVSSKMGIPAERVLSNVAHYGNTSAASIPLALDEAVRAGKVQPGHVIATAGFGAGLTWASAVVRFG